MTLVPLAGHLDVRMAPTGAFDLTPTWDDITRRVQAISWFRSRVGGGQGSMVLEDLDGYFDPDAFGLWGSKWHPVRVGLRGAVFPGTAGSYADTPSSAKLNDITQNLSIEVQFPEPPNLSVDLARVVDRGWASGSRAWGLAVRVGGQIELGWSPNGTAISTAQLGSGHVARLRAGWWLRVESLVSGGVRTTTWSLSDDGSTWEVVQSSTGGATSIATNSAPLRVGAEASAGGERYTGRLGAVRVYSGAVNPDNLTNMVAEFDPGRTRQPDSTTFVARFGDVWTLHGDVRLRPLLFWGFARPPVRRVQTGPDTAAVTVEFVDAAALLQAFTVDASTRGAEKSSERVTWALNRAAPEAGLGSWPSAWGGASPVHSSVHLDAGSGPMNAWQVVQEAARAEGPHASCFVSRSGQVRFLGRYSLTTEFGVDNTYGTVVSDDPGAGELPLFAPDGQGVWELSTGRKLSFADVTTAQGTFARKGSAAAEDMPETWSEAGLPLRDYEDSVALCDQLLAARNDFFRYSSVAGVQMAGLSPSLMDVAGALDVCRQAWVVVEPVGTGNIRTHGGCVVGVSHVVDVGGTWDVTLELEPANWYTAGFSLGDSQLFRLDHSVLSGPDVLGF